MDRGKSSRGSVQSGAAARSAGDHEQLAVVLRVDATVGADGEWRVRGALRGVEEDPLLQPAALGDGVEKAVLGIGEHGAVAVDGDGVHAPLETVCRHRLASQRRTKAEA